MKINDNEQLFAAVGISLINSTKVSKRTNVLNS